MNIKLPLARFISASLCFIACQSQSEPELHVLIWNDYIKANLIDQFEKQHHCRVIIDTYDSNESMYAKLKYSSGAYDIIVPSGYFLEIMSLQNMLHPLDISAIPNIKNIDPEYSQDIEPALLKYGVPYMISANGIAFRSDKVPSLDNSWNVFSLKKYAGRMTMLNDMRETIGAALIYLGYSVNTLSIDEIEKATNQVIKWKQNLAKFEAEQYKSGISSGEFLIVCGYNGDILQVMAENPNVEFFYPKEGIIISMDYLTIPQDPPNPELAHSFINYLLEGDVSAQNIVATHFLSPNLAAYDLLPQALKHNESLFIPKQIKDHAEVVHYLGHDGLIYNKAWEKIKNSQ